MGSAQIHKDDIRHARYICKSYEDRLQCLELLTLEESQYRQDLIEVFKMLEGFSSVSLHNLFMIDENIKGTTGHSCRLLKTRCT